MVQGTINNDYGTKCSNIFFTSYYVYIQSIIWRKTRISIQLYTVYPIKYVHGFVERCFAD